MTHWILRGTLGRTLGETLGGIVAVMPWVVLGMAAPVLAQQTTTIRTPAPYNACNVRSGPSTANVVVGTYRDGQVVTLLGENSRGWYRVQAGDRIGWIARQCLGR
ncbi:MAG: SH3 domain-containing protein [Cyanobacteria bacterium P01_A01_bin.105]